jgi:hypothetical protein
VAAAAGLDGRGPDPGDRPPDPDVRRSARLRKDLRSEVRLRRLRSLLRACSVAADRPGDVGDHARGFLRRRNRQREPHPSLVVGRAVQGGHGRRPAAPLALHQRVRGRPLVPASGRADLD